MQVVSLVQGTGGVGVGIGVEVGGGGGGGPHGIVPISRYPPVFEKLVEIGVQPLTSETDHVCGFSPHPKPSPRPLFCQLTKKNLPPISVVVDLDSPRLSTQTTVTPGIPAPVWVTTVPAISGALAYTFGMNKFDARKSSKTERKI